MKRLKTFLFFSFIAFIFISCNGKKKTNSNSDNITIGNENKIQIANSTFTGKVKEGTVEVSLDAMQHFISANMETGVYQFSKDAKEIKSISPGKIAMFYGHSIRKIISVEEKNDAYIVNTEYARLTDYYEEAHAKWDDKVSWKKVISEAKQNHLQISLAGVLLAQNDPADDDNDDDSGDCEQIFSMQTGTHENIQACFEGDIDDYHLTMKFKASGGTSDELELELTISRGDLFGITVKGKVSSFNQVGQLDVEQSALNNFSIQQNNIDGELKFEMGAIGLVSGVQFFNIPAQIEWMYLVGPVPVKVAMKANFRIMPVLTGEGASGTLNLTMNYHSNQGFSFNGASVTPNSDITDEQLFDGENGASGTIAAGISIGIEFPRFEISIFEVPVVPYLTMDNYYSLFVEPGIVSAAQPCGETRLRTRILTGIQADFFGIFGYAYETELFKNTQRWMAPGSECGPLEDD